MDAEALEKLAERRSLKESLARFMDPAAFTDTVPDRVKFTSRAVGKVEHDRLKSRRDIALKRADAAIRFFIEDADAQN